MRVPTRVIPDEVVENTWNRVIPIEVARNLWKRVLAVEVTRNPSKRVIPVGVVGVSLQSAEIILIEVSWFFLLLIFVLFFTSKSSR